MSIPCCFEISIMGYKVKFVAEAQTQWIIIYHLLPSVLVLCHEG